MCSWATATRAPCAAQVAYFVNSGSEANDMAMMMARMYTGNYDLLTLRNAYHGLSAGTMGLLSHSTWKFNTPTVSTRVSLPLSLCGCAIPHGKVHGHSIDLAGVAAPDGKLSGTKWGPRGMWKKWESRKAHSLRSRITAYMMHFLAKPTPPPFHQKARY